MKILNKVLTSLVPFQIKEYLKAEVFISKKEKQYRNLRMLFYSEFIASGDLVFDVGANLGNRTHTFLEIGAKVVSVEPQRKCRAVLRMRFGNRIKILPQGLGSKEGVKTFYISNTHTLSTFSNKWVNKMIDSGRFQNANWIKKDEIQITTLNMLISIYGKPKFIKIDVEGYESEVLKGLDCIIDFIGFEYAVPENIDGLKECLQKLNLISTKYVYNYAIGESMKFVSFKWLSFSEILSHISNSEFLETGVGDIYAKYL